MGAGEGYSGAGAGATRDLSGMRRGALGKDCIFLWRDVRRGVCDEVAVPSAIFVQEIMDGVLKLRHGWPIFGAPRKNVKDVKGKNMDARYAFRAWYILRGCCLSWISLSARYDSYAYRGNGAQK